MLTVEVESIILSFYDHVAAFSNYSIAFPLYLRFLLTNYVRPEFAVQQCCDLALSAQSVLYPNLGGDDGE